MSHTKGGTHARDDKEGTTDAASVSPREPSALEWVVAALGVLITVGILAFMVWQGVHYDRAAVPDIAVRADSVVPVSDGFVVVFSAENVGRATAAGVTISGSLRSGTGTVETRQVTLDYVPPHSTRGGGLIFATDPRSGTLRLTAEGYEVP